jgi:hypothetical protein
MKLLKMLALVLSANAAIYAEVPITVRISKETVPPGGMAQVKVLVTSPQPITGGGVKFNGALSDADGVALFSSTGDVFGAAVQNGGDLDIRFVSPNGTFGTDLDYPILAVTFGVGANAVPGNTTAVNAGSAAFWKALLGGKLPIELKPGSVTIGGSVSITNVVPGGGTLPAGFTFRIEGVGFTPKTEVDLGTLSASAITYVSPSRIDVTLRTAATMDGVSIRVRNPDHFSDIYYCYLRGMRLGRSANPLIAAAVPIFSTKTALSAVLPPLVLPQINSPYVVGLALQNPGLTPADIALELHSSGAVLAAVQLTLDPGTRMTRELSEWFGTPAPFGAYVTVKSTHPVQTLALLGNTTDGVVLPMALAAN